MDLDDFDGLLTAFWTYERALLGNDLAVLDALSVTGASTLRADEAGVLVGHEAISDFRRRRPASPPARVVERLHVRAAGPGSGHKAALVVAETVGGDGDRGVQTQLWQRTAAGWQVAAAHLSALPAVPAPSGVDPRDPRIWRLIEDHPLREATGAGPLDGLGVAVKDVFALRGQRIGAGNPDQLAAAAVESTDAPAIARLLAAGARVAGIAHTDEFTFSLAGQNPHYGTPPNAAAPGRISGGSTSGPAAALAAGLADIGLGTDCAGSIRVPASYCGLYGLRPTYGAIPVDGVFPLAPSFDTVGLLARDPRMLAAAAAVLLPAERQGVERLIVAEDVLALVDTPMRLAFLAGLRALAGRTRRPVQRIRSLYDGNLEAWATAFRTAQAAEAWRAHGAFVTAHAGRMDPSVEARFRAGSAVTDDEYAAALDVQAAAVARLDKVLPPGAALALPAASSVAPPLDAPVEAVQAARAATVRLTCAASLSGRPALVVPALRVTGLPAGLCLLGGRGTDLGLLDLLP